jgi:uncharacterized protein (UPF0548 family)
MGAGLTNAHLSWRLDVADAGRLCQLEERASLTYSEIGMTASPAPSGYHEHRVSEQVATGRAAFERLAAALNSWQLHRRFGFAVYPVDVPVRKDLTVLLSARIGLVVATASARVVDVVDEHDRQGFTYGTLPLHPEIGEEDFEVSIDQDDKVHFTTVAYSRPGDVATRMAGSMGRLVQRGAHRRYLKKMAQLGREAMDGA